MLPPLSARTSWPQTQNALLDALDARRRAGLPIIDLTASNPTTVGLSPGPEALTAFADPRGVRYAPDSLGLPSAREAIAAYYAERGVRVDPAHVVVSASTSEAYSYLFALLADHGDEVLVPVPSYPLFSFLADLSGVRLVPYPLSYEGRWSIDLDALRDAVGERTRAILVVSPNNPTGSYLKRDELATMRQIASERGLAIIADEVFADFGFASDARRAPTLAAETAGLSFALSGLSKVAALPQAKLGWLVAAGAPQAVAAACERLAVIADTYLSVGTPVQLALPSLLANAAHTRAAITTRTARNLAHLCEALAPPSPASALHVEGGWYAVARMPATQTALDWSLALLERGVYVHPGHFYDFEREAYLVLSLLAPEDAFARAAVILATLADSA